MFDNSTHPNKMRLPEKGTDAFFGSGKNASVPFSRRNLTMLNVLQQNIGGFCPVSVCAPED